MTGMVQRQWNTLRFHQRRCQPMANGVNSTTR
jgi:hypothetical protein